MIIRRTQWLVAPEDEPRLYSDRGYMITIVDDGDGEFIELRVINSTYRVEVTPDEWPKLREAIDDAVDRILDFEHHSRSGEGKP